MALSTYTDLKTAIADHMGRPGDAVIAAIAPDLIALAEQRIFYGTGEDDPFPTAPLRVRFMEEETDPASYVTVAGARTLALPTGFLGLTGNRFLYLDTSPIAELEFAPARAINLRWMGATSGRPRAWTLTGDNLRFGPTPDAAYGVVMGYYKKPDPLSTTPTNWLLTNAPGVYLYAALLEAMPYLKNDARLATWASLYRSAIGGLMRSDSADRWSGPLVARPESSIA